MDQDGFTANDKHILRELAKKNLEYANSQKNLETIRLWYKHNACQGERPMVHIELNTFWDEVVPKRLECQSEAARWLEKELYNDMVNFELFGDDRPVLDYFPVRIRAGFLPFGIQPEATYANEGLGYHVEPVIRDLEQDFHLLGESQMPTGPYFDTKLKDMASETFGDILPPKLVLGSVYSCPCSAILALMGMETMFMSMYDYPELFHKMMSQYTNDTLRLFDHMEKEGLILPTVGGENLTMGSFCYTNELPGAISDLNGLGRAEKCPASGTFSAIDKSDLNRNCSKTAGTVADIWGHMNCQEAAGLSQDMFAEFIFPYYKKISDRFGMLSYGCCEAVHPQWDSLKTLENLRKLSISPWCDEEFMGDELRGTKIIYHRKPAPHYIGVGTALDEDAVRADIRRTIKAARGCTLEITQRDVYSINHDEEKVRRYVEIIHEECSRHES